MKKFWISFGVILLFGIYLLVTRSQKNNQTTYTPLSTDSPTLIAQVTTQPTSQPVTSTTASPEPTAAPTTTPQGKFKDGIYTSPVEDAEYGNIQIKVTISGGKINDVTFVQYPNDRDHSIEINNFAMPILKQEAIAAQSASVDIVSGATASSLAFRQALQAVLIKAS